MSLDVSFATLKRTRCRVSGLLLMEVPETPRVIWFRCLGLYWGYMGRMNKNMETTIAYWG